MSSTANAPAIQAFITRWQVAGASVADIAAHFKGKRTKKRVEEMTRLLEILAAVGRARKNNDLWSGA